MADAEWYFAKGDKQSGPITAARLKQAAGSGELGPEDLVWKAGMDDWKPAGEIPGLFPSPPEASTEERPLPAAPLPGETVPPLGSIAASEDAPPVQARPKAAGGGASTSARGAASVLGSSETARYVRLGGVPFLLLGLLLVLTAKGCDSIGHRKVARLQAKAKLADNAAQQGTGVELEARQLEALRRLKNDAANADAANAVWAYWRQIAFVFGTLLLTIGLLAVGCVGQGAERWICLIMLAVIIYSVFVGGAAWGQSIPRFLK